MQHLRVSVGVREKLLRVYLHPQPRLSIHHTILYRRSISALRAMRKILYTIQIYVNEPRPKKMTPFESITQWSTKSRNALT